MFPNKKFFFFPDGWEDLGEVNSYFRVGGTQEIIIICNYCKCRLCIGRENGKLFKFCPRCMLKTENDK